jgi:hypothetical protein
MARVSKKIEVVVSLNDTNPILRIPNAQLEKLVNLKSGTIKAIFPGDIEIESLHIQDG